MGADAAHDRLAGADPAAAAERHPEHGGRADAEYVLPIRWDDDAGVDELTAYLTRLSEVIPVTVVDASPPELFEAHARAWGAVRHMAPTWEGANGKARGAMTGIAASRFERVVIADDDVRYTPHSLRRMLARLDRADFVRPQNVFATAPWHARWDTGRSLMNRAFGGDFSGTVGVRRSIVIGGGGYDTDVLFENLQLERTVRARGGTVDIAADLYVSRRPPTVGRFLEQRVRQAYDDFAQPVRLVRELAILPLVVAAVSAGRFDRLALAAVGVIAVAETGRRRGGGAAVFPPTAALWAPLWLAERAVTVWAAVLLRLRGGVRYRDRRLTRAAASVARLRKETA